MFENLSGYDEWKSRVPGAGPDIEGPCTFCSQFIYESDEGCSHEIDDDNGQISIWHNACAAESEV